MSPSFLLFLFYLFYSWTLASFFFSLLFILWPDTCIASLGYMQDAKFLLSPPYGSLTVLRRQILPQAQFVTDLPNFRKQLDPSRYDHLGLVRFHLNSCGLEGIC
jgi:hypothetical protein